MTTADWIKRRRELLDAASPAPLHFQRWGGQKNQNGDYAESILFDASGEPLVYELSDVEGELIADARSSLPLALDALEAVLARHQPIEHGPNTGWVGEPWDECRTCLGEWPCATVDAIETALAGGCSECRQTDGHHQLDCGRRTS